MPATIKIFQLLKKLKAQIVNLIWQALASYVFAGLSISLKNITLWLFNYEIWFNNTQDIIQHFAGSLPVINRTREFLFTGPSIAGILGSSKGFLKPENENFIATGYFNHDMPLPARTIFSLLHSSDVQTAFTVNNSSEIGNLCNGMIFMINNFFSHNEPFVNYSIALNERRIHGERLNEKDSVKEYAKV